MSEIEVAVSNIGGIDELSVTFEEGATMIAGPNASNKTSLLHAIAFAFGADSVPLRSGTDRGHVRLRIGGRTIERTAERTATGIRAEGDTWIDNPEDAVLVDRFATLLETNPLRVAVSGDGDVEDLLKEPMNVDALEAERSRLLSEKRDLGQRLEKLSNVDERLADRRRELESQREHIAELEAELEELYDQQADVEGVDEELQELREERADAVSEREQQNAQIEELEATVDRLEGRLEEVDDEIEAAREEAEGHDVDALRERRVGIEEELAAVTERIDVLQSVLTANREMLGSEYTGVLGQESGLVSDELTCWACGQAAAEDDFEATIDSLQSLIERDKQRKAEREPELEALSERIESAREAERRVRELEADRSDLKDRLENRRESLAHHRDALSEIRERVADLDERIADLERDQTAEQSDVAERIESTRVEIETSRRDIEQLEAACEELRKQRAQRDELENELESVSTEITELTERIEGIEVHLREEFNTAMDDLIDALGFDRIDRVWLDGDFELVIAREVDGHVREDSLEHLAESEREMIGLVLGLAGYLTYDVADVAPVLAIDSLGAFDADRADRLLSYFAERTDLLVAAVHPNMATRLDFETITFGEPARP
ncbi:MAG: archaea-specific SMC-related protein [Haloferacaceae archaeon]